VIETLVVDANPLVSALLGGNARRVVFSQQFLFYSPQATLFEVEKYLPYMAAKLQRADIDLFHAFQLLPVTACQPRIFDHCVARAERLIGQRDPKDVPVLALSLHLGIPVWTEDHDFHGLEGVQIRRTSELLQLIDVGGH
jgi:predicted nucleic acid-binding protein